MIVVNEWQNVCSYMPAICILLIQLAMSNYMDSVPVRFNFDKEKALPPPHNNTLAFKRSSNSNFYHSGSGFSIGRLIYS
jgi:hypothetical protein